MIGIKHLPLRLARKGCFLNGAAVLSPGSRRVKQVGIEKSGLWDQVRQS